MKKYLFLMLSPCLTLLFSCHEEEIQVFGDKHEVYFKKFYMDELFPGTASKDSTTVSYFFYSDNQEDAKANLVVNMTGKLLTSDLKFGLRVIEEGTTATPEEYTIDDYYVFHANNVGEDAKEMSDTIGVKLHRTPRMDELPQGVRLVVELVPGEGVGLGQFERRRAVIIATTVQGRPDWWTKDVEFSLLGTYSQKKYKLFLEHADKKSEMSAELIEKYPDRAIKLAMQFKQWLSEQEPAIAEDDGSLMEVTL